MRARISDAHTGLRQAIGGAPLQTITVGPNQADLCPSTPRSGGRDNTSSTRHDGALRAS